MSLKDILSQKMKTNDYIESIAKNNDWFPVKATYHQKAVVEILKHAQGVK